MDIKMNRLILDNNNREKFIIIKDLEGLQKICSCEIYYFEIVKRKLNIYLIDGRVISTWKTIKELYNELKDENFIKINSGCVVNIKYIKELSGQDVFLDNEQKLVVSRSEIKLLKSILLQYWEVRLQNKQ